MDSHSLKKTYSPLVEISTLRIRSKHSSAQERQYNGYTPWPTLWFYLYDHAGEDMTKGDEKSTLTLEARVCELQGKPTIKQCYSRKIAALVSSVQL